MTIWKETTSDGPEQGELMSHGLTIRQYIQQWDDLSIIEGVFMEEPEWFQNISPTNNPAEPPADTD